MIYIVIHWKTFVKREVDIVTFLVGFASVLIIDMMHAVIILLVYVSKLLSIKYVKIIKNSCKWSKNKFHTVSNGQTRI